MKKRCATVAQRSTPKNSSPPRTSPTPNPTPPRLPAISHLAATLASPGDVRVQQRFPTIAVEALDESGSRVQSFEGEIALTLRAGSGVLSGTLLQRAVGGVAEFTDITYSTAEEIRLTFVATDRSLTRSPEGEFATVVRGRPAVRLALQTPPFEAAVYRPLESLEVRLLDASGALASEPTLVTIASSDGDALAGTTAAIAQGGTALFSDLMFTKAGSFLLSVSAPGIADETIGPFTVRAATTYAYTWDRRNTENMPQLLPWHWLRGWEIDISPRAAAERTIAALDAMPEGHRVLYLDWYGLTPAPFHPGDEVRDSSGTVSTYRGLAYHGLWWDNSARAARARNQAFVQEFVRLGGTVDYIVVDSEQWMGTFSLERFAREFYGADPLNPPPGENPHENRRAYYRAIENDPRFSTAQSEGIVPGPAIRDLLSFRTLVPFVSDWFDFRSDPLHRADHFEFSALMADRAAAYKNYATFEPYVRHFPYVAFSEFGYHFSSPEYPVPDEYGHPDYVHSVNVIPGTHQAPSLYGQLPQLCQTAPQYCPGGTRPFNAFRHQTNRLRASQFARPDVPVTPWIQYKESQDSGGHWKLTESDYYQEGIFAILLQGASPLIFWNPQSDTAYPHGGSRQSNQILNDCLATFDAVSGGSLNRIPLEDTLLPWNSRFARTCMRTDKSEICRVALDIPEDTTAAMLVESEYPARFRVGGETLEIPGGRILRVDEGTCASTKGIWVERQI